jgi:hypothetical protein
VLGNDELPIAAVVLIEKKKGLMWMRLCYLPRRGRRCWAFRHVYGEVGPCYDQHAQNGND